MIIKNHRLSISWARAPGLGSDPSVSWEHSQLSKQDSLTQEWKTQIDEVTPVPRVGLGPSLRSKFPNVRKRQD